MLFRSYQGLSSSFNTSAGGTGLGFGNSVWGGGSSPFSTSPFWQPGASSNLGYYFHNVGNSSYQGWNSQAPPHLPFLATLKFLDLLKLTNDPIQYSLGWPLVPTNYLQRFQNFKEKMERIWQVTSPLFVFGVHQTP